MKIILIGLMFLVALTTAGYAFSIPDVVSDTNTNFFDTGSSTYVNSVLVSSPPSVWPAIADASWIWSSDPISPEKQLSGEIVDFQKAVDIPACGQGTQEISGTIDVDADNFYSLKVNGNLVGFDNDTDQDWKDIETYDISSNLHAGSNLLDFHVTNIPWPDANPGGLIYKAHIEYTCDQNDVPEFGTIAAVVALAGAVTAFIIIRKH